jgi:RNA polymerase sigma-70 factor (ECF subfamily)
VKPQRESGDELVAAARRGDAGALEALYTTYVDRVAGYVRGLGVPDPDDTVSEVFVSVVRDLKRFTGDEVDFRRWLFTVAHRRAVDAHRKRARRREQTTDPAELSTVGPAPDALEDATARLAASDATELLDHLTDDQRAVILLRVVADLSVADAAEILGKQPGAIKTLQRRALASLRRLLILTAVS